MSRWPCRESPETYTERLASPARVDAGEPWFVVAGPSVPQVCSAYLLKDVVSNADMKKLVRVVSGLPCLTLFAAITPPRTTELASVNYVQ